MVGHQNIVVCLRCTHFIYAPYLIKTCQDRVRPVLAKWTIGGSRCSWVPSYLEQLPPVIFIRHCPGKSLAKQK